MSTATRAKSAFEGTSLYQLRARRAFPLLVRQAKAGKRITYGDLARALDIPNPQNMNYVLGSVGNALADLERKWNRKNPKLTAVVINQDTKQPSDGVLDFFEDPESFKSASFDVRQQIIDKIHAEIYTYPYWNAVLRHWGLEPVAAIGPSPVPTRGKVPEGDAHRQLKEYVASHPEATGLRKSAKLVAIEASLRSGDEVDVLFSTRDGPVATEVKAHNAADPEIARGMYQCVKYEAVLRAQQRADQTPVNARAWLVLGRDLPDALVPLKNTLGIHVVVVTVPALHPQ